jgi:hypothetical protein
VPEFVGDIDGLAPYRAEPFELALAVEVGR